jgi:hypothetical protein
VHLCKTTSRLLNGLILAVSSTDLHCFFIFFNAIKYANMILSKFHADNEIYVLASSLKNASFHLGGKSVYSLALSDTIHTTIGSMMTKISDIHFQNGLEKFDIRVLDSLIMFVDSLFGAAPKFQEDSHSGQPEISPWVTTIMNNISSSTIPSVANKTATEEVDNIIDGVEKEREIIQEKIKDDIHSFVKAFNANNAEKPLKRRKLYSERFEMENLFSSAYEVCSPSLLSEAIVNAEIEKSLHPRMHGHDFPTDVGLHSAAKSFYNPGTFNLSGDLSPLQHHAHVIPRLVSFSTAFTPGTTVFITGKIFHQRIPDKSIFDCWDAVLNLFSDFDINNERLMPRFLAHLVCKHSNQYILDLYIISRLSKFCGVDSIPSGYYRQRHDRNGNEINVRWVMGAAQTWELDSRTQKTDLKNHIFPPGRGKKQFANIKMPGTCYLPQKTAPNQYQSQDIMKILCVHSTSGDMIGGLFPWSEIFRPIDSKKRAFKANIDITDYDLMQTSIWVTEAAVKYKEALSQDEIELHSFSDYANKLRIACKKGDHPSSLIIEELKLGNDGDNESEQCSKESSSDTSAVSEVVDSLLYESIKNILDKIDQSIETMTRHKFRSKNKNALEALATTTQFRGNCGDTIEQEYCHGYLETRCESPNHSEDI